MGSVIGEVITLINLSSQVWQSFSTAKDKLHDAYDVIRRSLALFELYKPQVEMYLDEKRLPENYKYFTRMMLEFSAGVKRLVALMEKYKHGELVDKAEVLFYRASERNDIVKKLNSSLEEFIGFIPKMEQFNKSEAERAKAEEDATKKQKAKASERSTQKKTVDEEKTTHERDLVVKLLLQIDRDILLKAAQKAPEWETIERKLVDMDAKISREDAKRILAPLREEIRRIVPPDAPNPGASTSKPSPAKMKQVHRIVCVDFSNAARSAMAQCHLEHIRSWTLNTTNHWLVNRIESAGVSLPTPFLEEAVKSGAVTIDKTMPLTGSPLHGRSLDIIESSLGTNMPDEYRAIQERMRLIKRHPLSRETLLGARHILCLGWYTHKILLDLQKYAKSQGHSPSQSSDGPNGQITLLNVDSPSDDASDEVLKQTLGRIQNKINGFLVAELNWIPPTIMMKDSKYQSTQFLIPHTKKGLLETKRNEICKKNSCGWVRMYRAEPDMGVLVTIVGLRDKAQLSQAEKEFKALL